MSDISDIATIPSAYFDVLDTGCICLDADCITTECGGQPGSNPGGQAVFTAVVADSQNSFHDNLYWQLSGASGRYAAQRMHFHVLFVKERPLHVCWCPMHCKAPAGSGT